MSASVQLKRLVKATTSVQESEVVLHIVYSFNYQQARLIYGTPQIDNLLLGFAALFCVIALTSLILLLSVLCLKHRQTMQILCAYFVSLPLRDEAGVVLGEVQGVFLLLIKQGYYCILFYSTSNLVR